MRQITEDQFSCYVIECTGNNQGMKSRCWACAAVQKIFVNVNSGVPPTTTLNTLPEPIRKKYYRRDPISDDLSLAVEDCIANGYLKKDSFHYDYIGHITRCLQLTNLSSVRYPLSLITLSTSLMWVGGRRALQLMRGRGGLGKGAHHSIKNDPKMINFFLPAPSTITKHLPPVIADLSVEAMARREARKFLSSYTGKKAKENGEEFIPVLLSSDEIAVRPGVQKLQKGDKLIGFIPHAGSETGAVPICGIANWYKEKTEREVEDLLAKNALTTLMTDLHGTALSVISQIPTGHADWAEHIALYEVLERVLREEHIRVVCTSTDCFTTAGRFVDTLAEGELQ